MKGSSHFWEDLKSGHFASMVRESSKGQTVSNSAEVYNILKPLVANHDDIEVLYGIFLDTKNHIIDIQELSRGTLNASAVYPREIVKKVIKDIKRYGKVVRGWWGIKFKTFTKTESGIIGHSDPGLLITAIAKNSPAELAGLKATDFIVSVEGKKIKTAADLMIIISKSNPGDILKVIFYRENKKLTIKITVAEEPVKN